MDGARLTADEIYTRVHEDGERELQRPLFRLGLSALLAGLVMGLTALGVGAVHAKAPGVGAEDLLANLLYPIGFLAVILGRAQLFTENTLYPVVVALEDRRWLSRTAALWAMVFSANIVGATLFALLAMKTPSLDPAIAEEIKKLGVEMANGSWGTNFWSGVIGGWMIAMVAWLVAAARDTVGQFLVIFALTFAVGLGGFDHCIASAAEVLSAWVDGEQGFGEMLTWLSAATLGNIAGGVLIVAGLNYGQSGGDEN